MSHTAQITRKNPGYFIFLVDQSGSMNDPHGGNPGKSKADSLSDALNRILQSLIVQCGRQSGVADYFCCSLIGYGSEVTVGFPGTLAGRPFATTSELDANPSSVDTRQQSFPDGAGGIIERPVSFPVWIKPIASGATPMCAALNKAHELAAQWVIKQPNGFPPIVINLTDGESTDGDPSGPAKRLTTLGSSDGNVLLFNMHLSTVSGQAVLFPSSDRDLTGDYARQLFAMSSSLPHAMYEKARGLGLSVSDGSRGFAFNADIVTVIQFLKIGTDPANLALR